MAQIKYMAPNDACGQPFTFKLGARVWLNLKNGKGGLRDRLRGKVVQGIWAQGEKPVYEVQTEGPLFFAVEEEDLQND